MQHARGTMLYVVPRVAFVDHVISQSSSRSSSALANNYEAMWQLVFCLWPTNCLSTYAKGLDLYMANVTYSFSCLNELRRREEILASC